MSTDPQGLRPLPVAAAGAAPPRHETVLPAEPDDALDALGAALAGGADPAALSRVAAEHPAMLDAWARLSQRAWRQGDAVTAYAFARTGYHRGLDRLRKHGWGGSGLVRWSQETNRGFLRALHALVVAAAALGERDESARCRAFLLELDPDDGVAAAGIPEAPGPEWVPDPLP